MKVITYLEEAIEDISYESLGKWCIPDIDKYSKGKNLFDYQQEAIKNAIKVLNVYYTNRQSKKRLFELCVSAGMNSHRFDVPKFDNGKENSKYNRLINWFNKSKYQGKNIISGENFFNRTCFWMATASGKTLLIIKMIEILDYMKRKELIPKNDFMVLLPSEKIQNQFIAAVDEYNLGKDRKIKLASLKKYDDEVNSLNAEIFNEITVYVYRSDLLSNEEKTRKVDTLTYDNDGKWYIFMDEAHKGDKEDSLRQDYITIMSRNGFLFNFSATFTDNMDFATTCYNFNLDKFIQAKYGKNIYLSESKYQFKKKTDDFSEKDKQLQVLKSLITLTLVKQSKKEGYYHNPLMVTLVNEVNTEESDTDLFFTELAKVAKGSIDKDLFEQAKYELYDEFVKNQKFQFGDESLKLENDQIKTPLFAIDVNDVLSVVFNASSPGQIQVVEGEKGKEFALKLATAEKPFALFRIGDASQYIREKLNGDYLIEHTYEEKHYFDELNTAESPFTMLIGSRMFYEGWDSNRPNVMNFINIGTGDAKKFVLQSLGRGVRIEPTTNKRRRLSVTDSNKNQLLETLFVFATNRNAVQTILETMDTQKSDEKTIELKATTRLFDLLIPYYKEKDKVDNISKFHISKTAYDKLVKYVGSINDNLLLLNTNIDIEDVFKLREGLCDFNKLFKLNSKMDYHDMPALLKAIVAHLSVNEKYVDGVKELGIDDIIHFKHIKIAKEKWDVIGGELASFIETSALGSGEDEAELISLASQGKITPDELLKRLQAAKPETEKQIGELKLYKVAKHYYTPLILSLHEKLGYIKHIIDVSSEVDFVNNLVKHTEDKKDEIKSDWMFSKVDQTIDNSNIAMPYYSMKDNSYHLFYPDFIFWLKDGNNYRIIFVDPKGTEHASYLSKVDGFEKLFYKDGQPVEFKYKDYTITFNLKLAYEDEGTIPEKYKDYWISTDDFTWLK